MTPLYRLAWIFYLLLALGAVVWIGLERGRIPLGVFVDRERWALDCLLGLAAGALLVLLWRAALVFWPEARTLETHLRGLLGPLAAREALGLALLSGFSEELFFRGAVQGAWGYPAAAVLFALLHTGWSRAFRVWTLYAALAGLLFGALLLWRGSLLAPALAHVLVNAVNLRRLAPGEPAPALC